MSPKILYVFSRIFVTASRSMALKLNAVVSPTEILIRTCFSSKQYETSEIFGILYLLSHKSHEAGT